MATIIINRNTGNFQSFTPIEIFSNDINIVPLLKGEWVELNVEPGAYRIRAEMRGGYESEDLSLEITENETACIEISTIFIGRLDLPVGLLFLVGCFFL